MQWKIPRRATLYASNFLSGNQETSQDRQERNRYKASRSIKLLESSKANRQLSSAHTHQKTSSVHRAASRRQPGDGRLT